MNIRESRAVEMFCSATVRASALGKAERRDPVRRIETTLKNCAHATLNYARKKQNRNAQNKQNKKSITAIG
jgi:hypothetical protein